MIKHKSINQVHYMSPDGKKYYFNGRLRSHSNTGIPPVKFIEDFGVQQNGSTVRDWRINPRTLQFDIFLQGDDCCYTRGELLAQIINDIRPNRGATRNKPGWVRFLNDNVKMMEIPAFILQGPSGNYNYGGDIGKYQVSDSLQFYCPDPIWREVDQQSITVTQGEPLEEESCIPDCLLAGEHASDPDAFCLFSEVYFIESLEIEYLGTWNGDQIDITFVGPMSNPVIRNVTQDTQINMTYTIPAGDYVTITIRPEYVTVIDNNGTNLIGTISSISDLVDFVLLSPGEITPDGTNVINVVATGAAAETEIIMAWWVRHISAYGWPECE